MRTVPVPDAGCRRVGLPLVCRLSEAERRRGGCRGPGASHALTVHPETNQIQAADKVKGFTFGKVIPEDAGHTAVYDTVRPLVRMDGYSATILAYLNLHVL
jgi:hypothetical protein